MKLRITRKNIYWWIIVILLFTSVDTILFGTNGNRGFNYVPRIMAPIGILTLLPFRSIKLDKKFLVCFVMISIVMLSNVLYGTDAVTTLSRMLFIILAFSIVAASEKISFSKVFDDFMGFISIIAIFIEIFSYFMPSIIRTLPIIQNTSGLQYYTSVFGSVIAQYLDGNTFIRASSVFWEPGAFSIYLVVALVFQLFVFEKTNFKKVLLYLICIILTFSTTGIIAVAMLLFTYSFSGKTNGKLNVLTRCCSFGIIIVLIILFFAGENTSVYTIIFGKIIRGESTAKTRYASFIVPFRIMMDYPIFGVSAGRIGENMYSYALRFGKLLQASTMCTNTLSYQFGTYGLPFGILFIVGTWKFCKKVANNKTFTTIGLFATFFLAYFGENFFSFFAYLFVFWGFSQDSEFDKRNTKR